MSVLDISFGCLQHPFATFFGQVPYCDSTGPSRRGFTTPDLAAGRAPALQHLREMAPATDVPTSSASEVRLSPSMMASEIHRIQPAAPSCQSEMGPGAQPWPRAYGPSAAYPMPNDKGFKPLFNECMILGALLKK